MTAHLTHYFTHTNQSPISFVHFANDGNDGNDDNDGNDPFFKLFTLMSHHTVYLFGLLASIF